MLSPHAVTMAPASEQPTSEPGLVIPSLAGLFRATIELSLKFYQEIKVRAITKSTGSVGSVISQLKALVRFIGVPSALQGKCTDWNRCCSEPKAGS